MVYILPWLCIILIKLVSQADTTTGTAMDCDDDNFEVNGNILRSSVKHSTHVDHVSFILCTKLLPYADLGVVILWLMCG